MRLLFSNLGKSLLPLTMIELQSFSISIGTVNVIVSSAFTLFIENTNNKHAIKIFFVY